MESINTRIKQIRIACGMNQEDFGKVLGIKKSALSALESGRNSVTEQHIIMLKNWNGRPINEQWLRTGEGEMFLPEDRNEAVARLAADVFKSSEDSIKSRFITAMAKLSDEDWGVLAKIAEEIVGQQKKD